MRLPEGVCFRPEGLSGSGEGFGRLTADLHRRAPYSVREATLADLLSRQPAPRQGDEAYTFGFGKRRVQTRYQPGTALAQRQMAILFADLAGYSRLCYELALDVIWATVTGWWHAAADTIYGMAGWLNKVDGDGLMALFGLHDTGVCPATSGATCALGIIHQYAAYVRETDVLKQRQIGIRIGLAAGQVMCGVTYLGPQPVYDVLGPPVNLAAELQKAAPTNGILVDPEVRGATDRQFVYDDAGVRVGRPAQASVPAYRLVGGTQQGVAP